MPSISAATSPHFIVPLAILAVVATACDDEDDVVGSSPDGVFTAVLSPLNSSGVTGSATFTIDEDADELRIDVNAAGLEPDIVHMQHVHSGSSCPTVALDENFDQFIDVLEGSLAYGGILVPLDDNPTTQNMSGFPAADTDGRLDYSGTAILSAMLADLREPDPDRGDLVVKLPETAGLDLGTRTVVLHGVDPTLPLPGSVATSAGGPSQATLPVACGEID